MTTAKPEKEFSNKNLLNNINLTMAEASYPGDKPSLDPVQGKASANVIPKDRDDNFKLAIIIAAVLIVVLLVIVLLFFATKWIAIKIGLVKALTKLKYKWWPKKVLGIKIPYSVYSSPSLNNIWKFVLKPNSLVYTMISFVNSVDWGRFTNIVYEILSFFAIPAAYSWVVS